jgi:hypothetical protein
MCQAFDRPQRGICIPETHFVALPFCLDDHSDVLPDNDLVVLQRYVHGCSLAQAARKFHENGSLCWLEAALGAFIGAYRELLERAILPDLFSLDSEHVKVDFDRRLIQLFDTNNLTFLSKTLANNRLFERYRVANAVEAISIEELHRVKARICEAHGRRHRALLHARSQHRYEGAAHGLGFMPLFSANG